MKLIVIISLLGLFAATYVSSVDSNSSKETTMDKTEEQIEQVQSTNWFEENLDLYIPEEYIAFDSGKYKFSLRETAKDTLGFEYWLGNFTIADMVKHKDYTLVNMSTNNHTKLMYITSDYFIVTSYMEEEKGTKITYGSSLVYVPEKNELRELDSIIVKGIVNNKPIAVKEHYELDQPHFIENGYYDVMNGEFIKNQ